MKRNFYSPNGLGILIEIDKDYILFYKLDDIERQLRWYHNQIEIEGDVSEEDSKVDDFYSISINEWISDKSQTRQGRPDNWHFHMERKNWFTKEMKNFINTQLKINND